MVPLGIQNKNQPKLMWLISVTCCQSNNAVIYHRCVDTWAWAPPVANTPIQTHIKVLNNLRTAHPTCITDIQLRKHLCASQFSVTRLRKEICMQNQLHPGKALMTYPLKLLHFAIEICCNYHKWCLNIRAWDQRGVYFKCNESETWVVDL